MNKLKDNFKSLCLMMYVLTAPVVYLCFYFYIMEHIELENRLVTSILVYIVLIFHAVTITELCKVYAKHHDDKE